MTSTIRTVTTNMIFEVKDKTGRPMMTTHDPRCVYDDDTCKEMRAASLAAREGRLARAERLYFERTGHRVDEAAGKE